jgi:TRAP-type C4-dicarboxylate transport system permease small subunit
MVAEHKIVTSPQFGIRLQRLAGAALRTLLGFVLLLLVALNVVNAVARATGIVVIGVDEVLIFGMIWMVMLGMLLVTAERSHIALELLSARAGPRMTLVLSIVTHAVMAAACGYAALQSIYFVQRVSALGQTSMALGMPMLIPHSALVVGFGGTAIIALMLLVRDACALAAPAQEASQGAVS